MYANAKLNPVSTERWTHNDKTKTQLFRQQELKKTDRQSDSDRVY